MSRVYRYTRNYANCCNLLAFRWNVSVSFGHLSSISSTALMIYILFVGFFWPFSLRFASHICSRLLNIHSVGCFFCLIVGAIKIFGTLFTAVCSRNRRRTTEHRKKLNSAKGMNFSRSGLMKGSYTSTFIYTQKKGTIIIVVAFTKWKHIVAVDTIVFKYMKGRVNIWIRTFQLDSVEWAASHVRPKMKHAVI